MKKSLTILLLMCLSALCHELRAQNIDSLDNIVATALSESRRIEAISQLSFCTIGIDDERSEECFGEAISFYIKEEELPAAFELINRRIAKCNELGRTDLVIKTIDGQQAFLSQHGSSPEVVKVYNAASYAMIDEQDFELAAIYLMKSQAIAEANRDTSTMINNAFNLGYCYGKIDDYNQAIENFKEAERLTILSGDEHEHRAVHTPVLCGTFSGTLRLVTVFMPTRGGGAVITGVRASADPAAKDYALILPDGAERTFVEP